MKTKRTHFKAVQIQYKKMLFFIFVSFKMGFLCVKKLPTFHFDVILNHLHFWKYQHINMWIFFISSNTYIYLISRYSYLYSRDTHIYFLRGQWGSKRGRICPYIRFYERRKRKIWWNHVNSDCFHVFLCFFSIFL